jgi:hypothetical protein
MAFARGLVDNRSWLSVSNVPSSSGLSDTLISDSHSGVECHAQLNTSRSFRSGRASQSL